MIVTKAHKLLNIHRHRIRGVMPVAYLLHDKVIVPLLTEVESMLLAETI